jgi:hypothetical protein
MKSNDIPKPVIDKQDTVVGVFASEGAQTNTQRMSKRLRQGTGPVAQLQGNAAGDWVHTNDGWEMIMLNLEVNHRGDEACRNETRGLCL